MVVAFKKLAVVIYVILLVFLLSVGIYIADINTRSVGFEDAKPVFCCEVENGSVYIHIMGNELNIKSQDNGIVSAITKYNKKTAPLRTKVAKALSEFIKKIVGLFLRAVGR